MKLRAEPRPEDITAIIDSREQHPLDLRPLRSIRGTLDTGDYTIVGLEDVVRIERKGIDDLLSCVGTDRERFEKQLRRLLAFPVRALVVEASLAQIEMGQWSHSRVRPSAVTGSLLGWMAHGLPIVMAGDHHHASKYTAKLLYITARRRWREARTFLQASLETDQKEGAA